MNTTLYSIPVRYFPSVKIKQPFPAKVNYKVVAGKVFIEDICFSARCLKYITNAAGLVDEIQGILQRVEDKAIKDDNVHPIIMKAIAPHINY